MGSVYKLIEAIGSSSLSFEDAVQNAIVEASKILTNLRVAKVIEMDAQLKNGIIAAYRVKVRLSFKVEVEPETF
ncbi:MAG: dodecin family protein [Methanotrichaceae archaeon]|nr:dodecin family protein [Methanotrichaceae archaeon]